MSWTCELSHDLLQIGKSICSLIRITNPQRASTLLSLDQCSSFFSSTGHSVLRFKRLLSPFLSAAMPSLFRQRYIRGSLCMSPDIYLFFTRCCLNYENVSSISFLRARALVLSLLLNCTSNEFFSHFHHHHHI